MLLECRDDWTHVADGKGLRMNDPCRRLYSIYAAPKRRDPWRWLLTRPGIDGSPYPTLEVKLVNKRVAAFRVNGGRCGI